MWVAKVSFDIDVLRSTGRSGTANPPGGGFDGTEASTLGLRGRADDVETFLADAGFGPLSLDRREAVASDGKETSGAEGDHLASGMSLIGDSTCSSTLESTVLVRRDKGAVVVEDDELTLDRLRGRSTTMSAASSGGVMTAEPPSSTRPDSGENVKSMSFGFNSPPSVVSET
jgi:hypothetical protein